ncbi:MAG: hypothetical protein IT250_18190 [Chitinophagaceae bacterium]|nr:hypothetical protein [Chitinophagaceae bacterium]
MKPMLLLFSVLSYIIFSCGNPWNVKPALPERDTTITLSNAYSQLFFDSMSLEKYIHQQHFSDSVVNRFRSFYDARNFQYAWFFNDGPTEQAYNFLNMQSEYIAYSGDSSLYCKK